MAALGGNTCSDEEPQLSEHTLLALQEFYAECMQLGTNPTTTGLSEFEENWASLFYVFSLPCMLKVYPAVLGILTFNRA